MSGSHRRRNLQERIEAIFEFIERQPGTFPKSRLKEIGLNPSTAGKWLELIEYIQSQPKIRLIKSGHNTLIEKTEGNYQAMMRKMLLDKSVPFEERLQYSTDYLRSQYSRERVEMVRDSSQLREGGKSLFTTSKMYSLEAILTSFRVLLQLDPSFERYIHVFEQVDSITDEGERDIDFRTTMKRFMMSVNIQNDMRKFLINSSVDAKIQEIEEQEPGFTNKVNRAKKVLRSAFRLKSTL